ncbi:M17 family peptidase N-terminal domain-containing protein [Pararhodospirillum photometricum]|uniref:Leucyl aminopeptidase n=1 Tax=Pararhodospirillum photometricum DSM 122 TaxID=1150469 RepID=H6SKB6_PARPM|nr:Leucyl aminopeptidase [Pararhodospirillum photometricum DSM 122]
MEAFGGSALAALAGEPEAQIAAEPALAPTVDPAQVAAHVALGARLRSYRFDKYRTKEKPEDKPRLTDVGIHALDPGAAQSAFAPLEALAQGVFLTRNLVSEPAKRHLPRVLCRGVPGPDRGGPDGRGA